MNEDTLFIEALETEDPAGRDADRDRACIGGWPRSIWTGACRRGVRRPRPRTPRRSGWSPSPDYRAGG